MKEFICKKAYFIEDAKFASVGDKIVLYGNKVVNNRTNQQYLGDPSVLENITKDKAYFVPTFESGASYQEAIKKEDKVNHPPHYTWLKKKCGIEVIDITRHLNFCKGNAVKYLLRAGYKTEEGYLDKQKEIEDLKKAIWYIEDEINQLKKNR